MKRIILAAILMLMLPMAAGAQKRPNPFKSWKFWVETGLVVGIRIWDAESTLSAQRRDPFLRESFPIFSRRPSRRELYWKGGLITAGERGLIALIWRKKPRLGSVLSSMDAGNNLIFHSIAIDSNNSIRTVCPSGTTCNLQ